MAAPNGLRQIQDVRQFNALEALEKSVESWFSWVAAVLLPSVCAV